MIRIEKRITDLIDVPVGKREHHTREEAWIMMMKEVSELVKEGGCTVYAPFLPVCASEEGIDWRKGL
ncbi:MAG: hypothetical protein SWO11_01840 [Thermodesulfobacteriota bacterium]|nr:hypothetical protein [Thermodesulfobacteriota bacterium]